MYSEVVNLLQRLIDVFNLILDIPFVRVWVCLDIFTALVDASKVS